jgi:hypothetical protein
MTKLGFLALALSITVVAACGSDDKDTPPTPPTQTANGVFPASGFIGRELTVEISGDNTNWSSSTTVSFGTGVQVKSVMAASPTDLFADIAIDPTATPSVNDVVVTDGSNTYTLSKAFSLTPAIVMTLQGTAAQGSIGFFTITNKDFENPFDTTTTGDGFFSPLVYTNLNFTSPAGTLFQVSSATEFSITGQFSFDTDAASGPVSLVSGPAGGATVTSNINDFTIAQRTATALTSGTAASYMVMNPDDSALYQFTATNPTLLQLDVQSNGQTSSPTQIILPSSGKWAEVTNGTNFTANYAIIPAGGSVYPVVLDTSGSTGFSVTTTPTATTMTTADDTDPGNDTKLTAQAAGTLPFMLTTGTLASGTDQDWIKVTITAADAGKTFHVLTDGDPLTDVMVDIQDAAGNTVATDAFGDSGPIDDWYQEDVTSTTLSAGIYYIQIQPGSYFDTAHTSYIAGIWLE